MQRLLSHLIVFRLTFLHALFSSLLVGVWRFNERLLPQIKFIHTNHTWFYYQHKQILQELMTTQKKKRKKQYFRFGQRLDGCREIWCNKWKGKRLLLLVFVVPQKEVTHIIKLNRRHPCLFQKICTSYVSWRQFWLR